MTVNCGFLLLVWFLCGGFAVSRAQDERCEQGWLYYGGNCYFLDNNQIETWKGAQDVCAKKQANLVTVNDADEQKFLDRSLGNRASWCGLNNRVDKNVFKWVSGEQSGYTFWRTKEPSKSSEKRCVHIRCDEGHKWEMSDCGRKSRFMCEKALDPCIINPCQNEGKCYDLGNMQYHCQCKREFTGRNCEKVNCKAMPCKNGGTCIDIDNRSFCKCISGFTGTKCQDEKPSITKDPQDTIRLEGEDVTLCCEAKGTPTPEYKWFRNGAPLAESTSRLRLSSVSSVDAGLYRCRAKNEFGTILSSEAKLTVVGGSGDDSCDSTPVKKVVTLPPGCKEDSSGSNSVNVGACSYEACVKRNQGDPGSCGGQQSTRRCCSPASMSDSPVSCAGNGEKFNIQKVTSCACAECTVPDMVVRGKVVDPDGNPVKKGEITVGDGEKKYSTDLKGNFKFSVKSGTKRLVLTVKDKLQGQLEDTTKSFTLHEGQVSYYTIVLQKKPPTIKFQANQEQNFPLDGSGGKPSFVDLDIPASSFLAADGSVYDGEITSYIGVIDPRSQADMAAAPGDFSAIDENGEEVMLGTAGILRQTFNDANGNRLSLGKNITVRIDAEQLDIPDGVTVYQWYLSKQTGRWVKFGVLRPEESGSRSKRQARKFFVSEITPDIPTDTDINWDYVETTSYVRVRTPPGAVVTRIGLSDNGKQYTSYRQETVPASGILCILTTRDKPAILQAEFDGAPLLPLWPINFPSAVNPQIIDGSSVGNIFKIQSFKFMSTKADGRGPVYLQDEQGRCGQEQANDLAFEFKEANAGQLFHWESPRIQDPNDPRFWDARPDEICFVKALVTGSKPDSVIYVKSTGKAQGQPDVDYGYTAEKSALVDAQGVTCLEYRCNEGPQAKYQTHLKFLTLTGTCTLPSESNFVQGLNAVLNGHQGNCGVSPGSSSSRERNFCVPSDLVGGDAGLYTGDAGVAKNRCLTGNNQYNSGRPKTTVRSPTVKLNCD